MVVDATREFRSTFSELEQNQIPDELRWQLEEWYSQNYLPIVRRLLGKDVPLADYLPIGPPPPTCNTTISSPTRSRPRGAS